MTVVKDCMLNLAAISHRDILGITKNEDRTTWFWIALVKA